MHTFAANRLTDDVSVAPQIGPMDLHAIAAAGFRSVINNRPDLEGGAAQPTSAEIATAAHEAGLQYAHLPVHPAVHSPQDIERFAELLRTLPTPILVFCRSGARSTKLFVAANAL
jgi:uncharacterized protein (TIGR01244 family)